MFVTSFASKPTYARVCVFRGRSRDTAADHAIDARVGVFCEAGSDHLALAVAHLEPQDAGLVADKLLEAHDRGERVAALAMWYLREKINMRIDARGKPS